jgi:L-threonylcarbamoyladenylate synthase
MSPVVDCTSEDGRAEGIAAAVAAVRAGDVVVIPTDTVYGIGCDAFSGESVTRVLTAKGRDRDMPPPVLVPDTRTLDGLATDVPSYVRDLVAEFWPGPLTVIVPAQPSLMWDLGDTNGTVGLRMPDDEVALAILAETGPLAVTSANKTGHAPATTVLEAATQLGDHVAVYVDGGPRSDQRPSTIVDCTGARPAILREGSVPAEDIERVAEALVKDDDGDDLPLDRHDAPSDDDEGGTVDASVTPPADPTTPSGEQQT